MNRKEQNLGSAFHVTLAGAGFGHGFFHAAVVISAIFN